MFRLTWGSNKGTALTACFIVAILMIGDAQAAWKEKRLAPMSTDRYDNSSVLIKFKTNVSMARRKQIREILAGRLIRGFGVLENLEHVKIPTNTVDHALAMLRRNPFVEFAEPDYVVSAFAAPDDPYFPSNLWGIVNINAPTAWDATTGNHDTIIAIIDSGIDYDHPDLQANIWRNLAELNGAVGIDDDGNGYIDDIYGWDWCNADNDPKDDYWHGTHVAGSVGAVGDNGVGTVGVNWHVRLMSLKFMCSNGKGFVSDAIAALDYAIDKNVRVSNNSWGWSGDWSNAMANALSNAQAAGHLFIAAAGNDSRNNETTPYYPSSFPHENVISVASIDIADALSTFSNWGATSVDLGAPGTDILSTYPNNTYATANGTSMAAPHVSGAAGLIISSHPTWTLIQVKDRLLNNVRSIPSLSGKTVTGGTLNLAAVTGTARIGDFVWDDLDGDGVQDTGEPGLEGVAVQLQDCSGNVLTTQTTDATGSYRFDGLLAGSYRVNFEPPSGFSFSPPLQGAKRAKDSNPDPVTGNTSCLVTPEGKLRLGIDAGLVGVPAGTGSGKIGDRVWDDLSGDGIQDQGEPGLPGVTVNLRTCGGEFLASTITGADGTYLFEALDVGDYKLEFLVPVGYTLSPRKQGTKRGQDSDPFTSTGLTPCLPLASGQVRLGIDAGMTN